MWVPGLALLLVSLARLLFFLGLSFPIHAMGINKNTSKGCRSKRGAVCLTLSREPGTQQGFSLLLVAEYSLQRV